MSVTDKVLDALRQTVLVNERIERLIESVAKLENRQDNLRDRVTRIESVMDFALRFLPPPQGSGR